MPSLVGGAMVFAGIESYSSGIDEGATDMRFCEKLARLRKETNLSQEGLAERVGVSRQSVAKWESGESFPEVEKLIQLSRHFAVSIDSLLKDDESCSSGAARGPGPCGNDLVAFLLRAKKATYAGHGGETDPSRPNSHDLTYREGNLFYYDTYLGGERFAGEEAVWDGDAPVWSMNYSGRVLGEGFSGDFLKEALALVPPEMPFRGPPIHRNGRYGYHCMVSGDFDWYSGREEIFLDSRLIYECLFHGGTIR